jgi:hypothetical protein
VGDAAGVNTAATLKVFLGGSTATEPRIFTGTFDWSEAIATDIEAAIAFCPSVAGSLALAAARVVSVAGSAPEAVAVLTAVTPGETSANFCFSRSSMCFGIVI